jgi:HSP20 family molecular chaperone IbpA
MSEVQVQPIQNDSTTSESFFGRVQDLMKKVEERAYQLFEGRGRQHGYALDDWFQAEKEVLNSGHYEVAKTDEDFTIAMDVPGFKAKDLKVELIADAVIVEGEACKKDSGKKGNESFETETSRSVFQRIPLPGGVQSDHAKAELKNETLRITIPLDIKKTVPVEAAMPEKTETATA